MLYMAGRISDTPCQEQSETKKGRYIMGLIDLETGDYVETLPDGTAIDSDGHIWQRNSDGTAIDLDTGDLHFTSSWGDAGDCDF